METRGFKEQNGLVSDLLKIKRGLDIGHAKRWLKSPPQGARARVTRSGRLNRADALRRLGRNHRIYSIRDRFSRDPTPMMPRASKILTFGEFTYEKAMRP